MGANGEPLVSARHRRCRLGAARRVQRAPHHFGSSPRHLWSALPRPAAVPNRARQRPRHRSVFCGRSTRLLQGTGLCVTRRLVHRHSRHRGRFSRSWLDSIRRGRMFLVSG